jgi:hypothetical protein
MSSTCDEKIEPKELAELTGARKTPPSPEKPAQVVTDDRQSWRVDFSLLLHVGEV